MASRGLALEVTGGRTLRASMKQAGVDLQDLKDAHARVAQMVRDRAAAAAPVRTGRLAATVRGSGTKTAAIVRAGRASVPYAGPIHWGWGARHIRANPFLWNAIQDSREQWTGMYLAELNRIIEKIEGAPGP